MNNRIIVVFSLLLAVTVALLLTLSLYTNSNAYMTKSFDQAVIAYDGAETKADKLHALSVIASYNLKFNRTGDLSGVTQFNKCLYRNTLKTANSVSYDSIFSECI